MKLSELQTFLSDCIRAEIPFPIEPMKVVISDFKEVVPEEHQNKTILEFNHRVGNEFARVLIIPEPNK